jgi:thioredoxin 1
MPHGNTTLSIDDLNFEREVLASPQPFLLEFGATWCGPCRALAPVVHHVAHATAGRARVGTIDLDDAPAVAKRLGVRSVPTVVVFRGGVEVARHVGLTNAARLLELLGLSP